MKYKACLGLYRLRMVAVQGNNGMKERKKVKSLIHVWFFATPWTVAYHTPPSMDFLGKSIGVGYHFFLQSIFPT